MQHIFRMTERQASEQLKKERLHDVRIDLTVQTVKILFQVLITVLEDEGELLFTMQHIVEPLRERERERSNQFDSSAA